MIDWQKETQETISNLVRLVQVDTSNPPGNELPVILIIKEILERAGFSDELKILESGPGRLNLVARQRGNGTERPFLMSGHVDVVPVERDCWTHDPFGAEIKDGYIWGRGTLDMKGFLAMYLQVFILARRMGLPLKRDLILAAIADEENGFTHGSRFLVENHRELVEAEYGITEGGAMTVYLGKRKIYPIQIAEKGICWLKMTARGQPGHGSMPHTDNAVCHLADALSKLARAGHLPIHITQPYKSMVKAIADQSGFSVKLVAQLLGSPILIKLLQGKLPKTARSFLLAVTSNTASPTILQAGAKTNVIPSLAEAHIDCRLLPGQTPQDVIQEILAITGDRVNLETIVSTTGTAFSADTPFYHLMEKTTREMDS